MWTLGRKFGVFKKVISDWMVRIAELFYLSYWTSQSISHFSPNLNIFYILTLSWNLICNIATSDKICFFICYERIYPTGKRIEKCNLLFFLEWHGKKSSKLCMLFSEWAISSLLTNGMSHWNSLCSRLKGHGLSPFLWM